MVTESLLAYAHLLAIFTLVVFISSMAALCRPEWLNAAAVQRLGRVARVADAAGVAVLLTGLARMVWGAKGLDWYLAQPLLHLKLTLYVAIGLMSVRPSRAFRAWGQAWQQRQALPPEAEVRATRRWIMIQAHLLALVPLAAVLLARGVWVR